MNQHEKLNYVELAAAKLEQTKAFFSTVFAWQFSDYGPDYAAFSVASAGLEGGFYRAPLASRSEQGAALLVFYSANLEATQAKVAAAGGEICKAIFSFPGGRRFHFLEPSGNEFAVWSDQ
ncbi:VOC family protein [Balneatrix alpica]|uniref:VOC family protein n=1 Tax=Balneatrix alpica TaxID=75684 RepID=A0ABV5ZGW2_9GAMM|nr:VOC family protein [Balneatrix alpica]